MAATPRGLRLFLRCATGRERLTGAPPARFIGRRTANSGGFPGSCPFITQEWVYIKNGNLLISLVGVRGFEPPAPASRRQCSTRLSYTPIWKYGKTSRLFNPVCRLQVRTLPYNTLCVYNPKKTDPRLLRMGTSPKTDGGGFKSVPPYSSVIPLGSEMGQREQCVQVS